MAIIDSSCEKAIIFAKEINPNINIDNGINWIWASPFLSNEDAKKFDDYCNNNNCETRGVYSGDIKGTYAVRFR